MKLGTIFAFCAGAAVVIVGQRFVGNTGLMRSTGAKSRAQETCDAPALLKPSPTKSTTQPKALVESQADTATGSPEGPPVVAVEPPQDVNSQQRPEGTDLAPVETPRFAASPEPELAVTAPTPVEIVDEGTLKPDLAGVTLPPVGPKVADEARVQTLEPQATDSPPVSLAPPISAETLVSVLKSVRDVGGEIGSVIAEHANSTSTTLAFAKPRLGEDRPSDSGNVAGSLTAAPPLAETKPQEQAATESGSKAKDSQSRTAVRSVPRGSDAPVVNKPAPSATADAPTAQELEALKLKVRRVLDNHRRRMLNTRDHGAWEIMHSFIAYGIPKEVQTGGPGGKPVNAIGWICFNGPSAGERLFTQGAAGPRGRLGPGLQGHEGQFMAMLAQSRVEPTYPMKVDGKDYTIMDLVRQEQATCRPNSELTFKLIGLMHYLKSDHTWKDDSGQEWSIPRLIKEELGQPIVGATCGGTHRLFGLTYAYKKRRQRGEPVTGQYRRAEIYVQDFQDYTFKMQNPDGSFSTAFFAGRGDSSDIQRRLETTGHIAEWLTFSLEDQQLTERRMFKAIDYLATLLDSNAEMHWKVGPLGHALHALNMYDSYVFGGQSYPRSPAVAAGVKP